MTETDRSMYETIMDLPLFKGISADQVSSFIEKTKIDFNNYNPGDVVIEDREIVRKLRFLIKGSVQIRVKWCGGNASIYSRMDDFTAFGVTGLFGLTPQYRGEVRALSKISIMEFSKERYVDLLKTDSIYLMNYANYLSHQIQSYDSVMSSTSRYDGLSLLRLLVSSATMRYAKDIKIEFESESAMRHSGVMSLIENSDEEARKDLISISGCKIYIHDRERLLHG